MLSNNVPTPLKKETAPTSCAVGEPTATSAWNAADKVATKFLGASEIFSILCRTSLATLGLVCSRVEKPAPVAMMRAKESAATCPARAKVQTGST